MSKARQQLSQKTFKVKFSRDHDSFLFGRLGEDSDTKKLYRLHKCYSLQHLVYKQSAKHWGLSLNGVNDYASCTN